ncbi:MAG: hypothetical protein JF628_11525 [Sphingomonas sp.]|nr:hypothetical protein [Sphingomonas sp.]
MLTLEASAPDASYSDKMEQFGRFVGQWDLVVTWYTADGTVERQELGEWEFAYALEGRAVIDVWIVPPRAERPAGLENRSGEYGMSVRFYDPQIEAWRSTWHGPVNRVVLPFIARQVGDELVLERTEGVETTRWVFTEIAASSFRWMNMISLDDHRSWTLRQEMRAVRRLEAEADGSRGSKPPTAKHEQ